MDLFPSTIRALKVNDIPTVADIAENAMAYPWSEGVLRSCMKADYHGWVISDDTIADGKMLGFVVVLNQVGECQLLNVCVLPEYQRHGYGRQLLEHVIDHAQSEGLRRVALEVRASNKAAISIYHALGFIDVGLRKNYYPTHSGREDALIMVFDI